MKSGIGVSPEMAHLKHYVLRLKFSIFHYKITISSYFQLMFLARMLLGVL